VTRLFRCTIFFIGFLWSICCTAQRADVTHALDKATRLTAADSAEEAIVMADSALYLARKYDDHASVIRAMGAKGKALSHLKKDKEAVDLYFKALALCKPPADNKQLAFLYNEIGYAYYGQGHAREGKNYFEKELAVRRELYGNDSIGKPLINLAVMHQDLKEYDSARMALNEVAGILSRTHDIKIAGYYFLDRGALLQFMGNLDSATYYYQQAYDVWKSIGNESQIYKATFNLGFIAEQKKNYREAIKYYHLSEAAALKFGFPREIAHVYGTMAEAYSYLNDFKNAYFYLYKYANLSDSLSKSEFDGYVVKLDKQFQSQKNKETIQEQQLKLKTASLQMQQQRSKALVVIIILIAVVLVAVILFSYLTVKSRVRKQVEEAKAQFFANVVHEIRTPLSMVQGPIKILQSKVSDPALHYQLDIAERNTNRLNNLISQMLDISKIDSAKYQLSESVGQPDEFISELFEQYRPQADEKNIFLSKQTDGSAVKALFDRDAVEKIIGNLLGNAIKYTPPGGMVGLDVTSLVTEREVYITCSVWDTGPGIKKEVQQEVFSRFFRVKEQPNVPARGTGIGLSLVKDLVILMKGTIHVDSEPGKGSVFTVGLPMKKLETQAMKGSGSTSDELILLVEDDGDILDFNRSLLMEKGYNVITATNGNDALILLQEQLPDLVITDLLMPGKDGLALIRDIRANPLTGHIPVIILSARTSAQAKMEGVAEGAQVYLSKPFLPEELVTVVYNQLQLLEKQQSHFKRQTDKKDATLEERFAGSDPFTRKCFSIIQEHLNDAQLSVEKLAALMNINRSHFQRKIKALTGYSPSELIRTIRLEKAKELLQRKEGNITEIAYSTGFTSQSYFTKCFSDHFGYPPSKEEGQVVMKPSVSAL
jgi:two-component system, sensor histidine kinase ChiS